VQVFPNYVTKGNPRTDSIPSMSPVCNTRTNVSGNLALVALVANHHVVILNRLAEFWVR
jgi:hypothetical protein